MFPVGLRFEWRSLAAPRIDETFPELAVVTFQGTCALADLIPQRIGSAALGRTHVTDGQVLPFSEVNCDRIRAFLSQALIPLAPQDRNEAFGRAVARVLAHELYHIITRTAHHGSSGVARAAYTVPELMAGDFYFEKADLRALGALRTHRSRPSGRSSSYFGAEQN